MLNVAHGPLREREREFYIERVYVIVNIAHDMITSHTLTTSQHDVKISIPIKIGATRCIIILLICI